MRKSWPFALAVIVVGGLAGLAIAGRPVPADQFVLDPANTAVDATDPAPVATSTTTTEAEPAATTTSVASSTTQPPVSDTAAPTTAAAPTTTAAATTTTIAGPLPRDEVRLVIGNGDGRFRLASTTADRLRPLGYDIDLGDALAPVDATIIYYRPGFEDEAEIVAEDVDVPDAIIAAFPTNGAQITNSDDAGDVILVLGPDAPR